MSEDVSRRMPEETSEEIWIETSENMSEQNVRRHVRKGWTEKVSEVDFMYRDVFRMNMQMLEHANMKVMVSSRCSVGSRQREVNLASLIGRVDCAGVRQKCQKICQKRMSENICQTRMSEDISERIVRRDVRRHVRKGFQKICQKRVSEKDVRNMSVKNVRAEDMSEKNVRKGCQKECQKECQKICQKRMSENMSDKNVIRYFRKDCQKRCQKICQKTMSEKDVRKNARKMLEDMLEKDVRRYVRKLCQEICQKKFH